MSFFQMLVCIFLCVHTNLGDIPNKELGDFQTISLVSKWTSGYAALNRQLLYAANRDKSLLIDKLSQNRKEYSEFDHEYQSILLYQELIMKAFQNGDDSLPDQGKYLEKLSIKRDALQEEYITMKTKLDHARFVVRKSKSQLGDADLIQTVLETRAKEIEEFNSDGIVNDDRVIDNIDEIPAYGHVTNNDIHSDIACLLDDWLQIDASSNFWMWPVSNGYISAGTWSYPRREYALRVGYCRAIIQ